MNQTLEETIKEIYGSSVTVTDRQAAYGGDINASSLLILSDGSKVFLKENSGKPADFFTAEEEGLKAIAATGAIPCAHVIGSGRDGNTSFLLLEYIESGNRKRSFFETLGRELAQMHMADTSAFLRGGKYGFHCDNYIGATRQINTPGGTWIDFFRTNRLEVQFRMAWDYFDPRTRSRIGSLLDRLDHFLIEPVRPSLLHGDLWGGNFMVGSEGDPVLIDPAVYVGNAEADIAMTELFGGFSPFFYDAYRSVFPFEPGYAERKELYNLYHLLNHLNLFGTSYLGSVVGIAARYGAS